MSGWVLRRATRAFDFSGIAGRLINQPAGVPARDGGDSEIQVLVLDGGPASRLVLVGADLIWFSDTLAELLRRRIAALAGTPAEAVSLTATHTHGTLQPDPRFRYGEYAEDFCQLIIETALAAAAAALAAPAEPVDLAWGSAAAPGLAVNRRRCAPTLSWRPPYWRVQNLPNPARPVNDRLSLLAARSADGALRAVVVAFTCHPVCDVPGTRGGDYPAALRRLLRARLGADLPVLFLQGYCGDVRPDLRLIPRGPKQKLLQAVLGARFRPPRAGDTDALAAGLAEAAGRALAAAADLGPPAVRVARERVAVADCADVDTGRGIDMTAWRFSAGAALLFASGEMLSGLDMAAEDGLLSVGYSNGMLGYVAATADVAGGGYEVDGFLARFGFARRLTARLGRQVLDARARLAAAVRA